jgi:hypothetical protein
MVVVNSTPPENELGWVHDPNLNKLGPGMGRLPWGLWVDDDEAVGDLKWPRSIQVYDRMKNDTQCWGLYWGAIAPIQRYVWFIDQNECEQKFCDMLSQDLNLPLGKEAALAALAGEHVGARLRSSTGRFSWNKHLTVAPLSMIYGHYFFEQVGQVDPDGYWRLRKLAPRPPRTIEEIAVAPDGGLVYIKQDFQNSKPIPIDRLVCYVFQQEPGNWVGRSMYRPMYRNYLVKDRLIRVDAMKHERNGVGMPIVEAPPDATPAQVAELDKMAQEYKVGERGGGAIPHGSKFTLQGIQGAIPETIGSIRFHNEEMARAMLMMFMQLGQTETGSRALGGEFIDWFKVAQETIANWLRDTTTDHVIVDWWDWNVDPESDRTPLLAYLKDDDPEVQQALGQSIVPIAGQNPNMPPGIQDQAAVDHARTLEIANSKQKVAASFAQAGAVINPDEWVTRRPNGQ